MYIIGTDIGSISIATVALDLQGKIVASDYRFHQGEREKTLRESLAALGIEDAVAISRTSTSPDMLHYARIVDEKVAYIGAAKRLYGTIGSLLVVGAETFSIIHFGEDGSYKRLRTNSSCAAGTGSFLDQQASRLSLEDSSELSRLALENRGEVPKIASRCAVFAKTDLIHAQAEGYGLSEICDGLCLGLARNILDTLVSDELPPQPLIFAGGVARNRAVHRHLEQLLGMKVETDDHAPLLGAWGAALSSLEAVVEREAMGKASGEEVSSLPVIGLVKKEEKQRDYYYPPLSLSMTDYPDFSDHRTELLRVGTDGKRVVETDIYREPDPGSSPEVWLGIDIGSTSTKAVLSRGDQVYLGLYTRTSGKPLAAVQALFEAIRRMEKELGLTFLIQGLGTTGSGRKFIAKVIGADLTVDEITAHAKAAHRLDEKIDTIIEIGGQDSKFTTMIDGMVTFSQMNTICAAGTGSFIEEQAQKLGVPLSDYSDRAEHNPAPLTSDRCTVFMERDINNYLNQDYGVDEALAAALFSVRENYLQKVASEAHIGKHVCFQGATAKNRALVAAFEQKLQRPLFVSRYCHLTGALGTALILEEESSESKGSSFRGLDMYKREIPVTTEVCELCTNHCRIRIAEIDGETVAFGFLCGRDYHTHKYVDRNSSGFDLLKVRRKLFADASLPGRLTYAQGAAPEQEFTKPPLIALPAALHMVEQLPFWKRFFSELGFPTISSEHMSSPIKVGKNLTGAEFCAPMTAFHGHADYGAEKGEILFIPFSLQAQKEKYEEKESRMFCYYTQYSPALIKALTERRKKIPVLTPLIKPGNFPHNIQELSKALSPYLGKKSALLEIARAFSAAHQYQEERKRELKKVFHREYDQDSSSSEAVVHVVLLGRPYTVLSKSMNNNIPELFGNLGVKTFYQDMLPSSPKTREKVQELLSAFHWHYAADILEAAAYTASTPGLYPVYISSFKCSPDAFALDYFKQIMDAEGKPYLILQLDEHDSSVGYETRIEAGIRAFRNHARRESIKEEYQELEEQRKPSFSIPFFKQQEKKKHLKPLLERDLEGKTLLFPNWDPITSPLIIANLQREGIDARLLREDSLTIQKSMRLNSGQCLPVSIVAQEAMDYVQEEGLDPSKTVLWIARAEIACNIPMYPYYLKNCFAEEGGGMEALGVYVGDISHIEISPKIAIFAYFAYMFGGLLRKLACKIRPYEINKGETDKVLEEGRAALEKAFLEGKGFEATIEKIITDFESVERKEEKRPKVAIFGDLYVRDNDVMNQDLIHTIEDAGGEVITTPYNEYAKIISQAYFRKWIKQGEYLLWLKNRSLLAAAEMIEKRFYTYFQEFFDPGIATGGAKLDKQLERFHLTVEHDGESMENILKIFRIIEDHDEIALFVQASPSYCCPALISEAMNRDIERITGVPVVSVNYDGTGTFQNDRVVPYIKYGTGTVTDKKKELSRAESG